MSKNQSILIVEDELIIAHSMKTMLNDMGYQNIFIANNQFKAETILESEEIDLAILDINLGTGNEGIALAELSKKKCINFFYTTSYTDKKTIDNALETSPSTYIIKPVDQSALYTAVSITLKMREKTKENIIKIKDGNKLVTINLESFLFANAENNYVKIYTDHKTHLIRTSLQQINKILPYKNIVQVHRSFVVNIDKIVELTANHLMISEHEIPISRSYKENLRKSL